MMHFIVMKCICSVLEVQVLERIILRIVMTFTSFVSNELPKEKNENNEDGWEVVIHNKALCLGLWYSHNKHIDKKKPDSFLVRLFRSMRKLWISLHHFQPLCF